jgi:hypothetical protein
VVRHEERIEPGLFKSLDETYEMLQIEIGVGVGSRVAPPCRMDGDRTHDGAKMKLLRHVERSLRKHPAHHLIYRPCASSLWEFSVRLSIAIPVMTI